MKKKIAIALLLLVTLSGCTKRFTIEVGEGDKKIEKSYVSNILCKPESKDLQDIYTATANDEFLTIDYEKLPKCENLKINSGGYEGLWTTFFVKPLAWIIVKVGLLVKNYGLAIMLVGVALRAIMIPLTKKSNNLSENMKKAQKDLNNLEKKYKGKEEDRDAQMMKAQEMMVIYKKYDINPMSGCLFTFLQLPIFFAFLEAVYRVPAFFEKDFLVFNLGTTPLEGFMVGNYWYIILIVLIIAATYYTFRNMNNNGTNDEQAKQMKTMGTIMTIFISLASFSLPTSIALYWIVSNGFTIVQNFILKKGKK